MKHQTHNSMPNLVLFLSKALILEEALEEQDTKKGITFPIEYVFPSVHVNLCTARPVAGSLN